MTAGRCDTTMRVALLIFVGVSCLYAALSRGVFLYGDDILMYQVTEAIVERGEVSVTSPHTGGDVARSIPGRNGEGYAKYGIGQSLAAIPSYLAARWLLEPVRELPEVRDGFGNQRLGTRIFGTALVNALIGGAVAALTFATAVRLGYQPRTGFVLVLLLITGTLLTHYAATFLSEPLSALCLLTAVWALTPSPSPAMRERGIREPRSCPPLPFTGEGLGVRAFSLSGFAAGLAIATRLSNAVLLIPIGLWFLWLVWRRWRGDVRPTLAALLAWGVPVAGWLAVIGFYNWYRFGDIRESGYGGEATDFSAPFGEGFVGLLLSPGRGVFWYNPPLLLGVAGLVLLARRRPGLLLPLAGPFVATVLFYASYYAWHGGGTWGPRFLVPVIPLLLLPAGEIIERAWTNRPLAILVGFVALLGIAVTALGILVPFDAYVVKYTGSVAALDDALWRWTDSPLVVHAQRLDLLHLRPDIAAVRYGSPILGAVSMLLTVAGVLLIARAARQVTARNGVMRPSTRSER